MDSLNAGVVGSLDEVGIVRLSNKIRERVTFLIIFLYDVLMDAY